MKKWFLLPALLILLLQACTESTQESPCPSNMDLGTIPLLPGSRDFVPYPDEAETVVFVDTLGEEYPFRISGRDEGTVFGGAVSRPCPEDPEQTIRYEWTQEFRYLALTSDTLGLTFDLYLAPTLDLADPPARASADFMAAFVSGPEAPAGEPRVLSILVDPGNYPGINQPAAFSNELVLGDKTFQQVYYNEVAGTETGYELYYSPLSGIVGVNRPADSLFLIFERLE